MAAITAAVVVAGVAVSSAVSQRKEAKKQESAAKKAAAGQERSSIESAQLLQQQGIEGERFIREAATDAARTAQGIPGLAGQPLQRIGEIGGQAFNLSANDILSGSPSSQSAIFDDIRNRSLIASSIVPADNITNPVHNEIFRQAGISGERAGRGFSGGLFDIGRQGVLTAGDLAQIDVRGANRLGDIATGQAAGRASSLVGAAAPAASAIQGAGEARLLSDFAGQRFKTQQSNQLAQLAGRFLG